jgi:hypothetical protein
MTHLSALPLGSLRLGGFHWTFRAINKAEMGKPDFTVLLSTGNDQRKPPRRREPRGYAETWSFLWLVA